MVRTQTYQIAAANDKTFHISADCPGVQFVPDTSLFITDPEYFNPDGTFKTQRPPMIQVKAYNGCPLHNCVFRTDLCQLVTTTQSYDCELERELEEYATVRCSLTKNTQPVRSQELCFIDGPYGKVNDQRRKVVIDAYTNYYGSAAPYWDSFNCTITTIKNPDSTSGSQKASPPLVKPVTASATPIRRKGTEGASNLLHFTNHMNAHTTAAIDLLYIIVLALAALVVVKEFFKVVIVLGSMVGVQRFRRPSWFILAVNSPLLVLFMPSSTFRKLATQSQIVGLMVL